VSLCKGAFVVQSSCMMRVFLVWKRRCADVRAGTQAPPLRFRLGGLCVGGWFRLGMGCAWPTYSVWVSDVVQMSLTRVCEWLWENQACRACTFDSPGLATIGAYPEERRGEKIYAIGIVLSLNSFEQKE